MQCARRSLVGPARAHRRKLPHGEREQAQADEKAADDTKPAVPTSNRSDAHAKRDHEGIHNDKEDAEERPGWSSDGAEFTDGLVAEAVTLPLHARHKVSYCIKKRN